MNVRLIPSPKFIKEKEGSLCIKPVYSCSCADFDDIMKSFSETADKLWGIEFTPLDIPVTDESLMTPLTETQLELEKTEVVNLMALPDETRCDKGIAVRICPELEKGAYRLKTEYACVIEVSDREGLCSALATVLQIGSRTCDKYIRMPMCEIEDRPDSTFRCMMLDVARRWHPVDYLYKYVDLCSLLKINRFIIHFTDDQSYTLPCESFPKLPTKSRHYTALQIKALCEYAHSRGVMIIPEIDMPGHSARFQAEYPEIFGTCGIMDATDEAFDALDKIYREASELFCHSDFIHVGGDEAVLGRWGDSEKTLAYMKKEGIADFVQLYGHYVGRVCKTVLSTGKTPIAWEGFHKESNDNVPKETLVMVFESYYQLAPELAEAGFRVLNASWQPVYIVAPWRKWSPEEILTWDKYIWDHWWEGSPAHENRIHLSKDAACDGGALCAWGDYLMGYESSRLACQLEFKTVIPRLAAVSEKLWEETNYHSKESFDAAYNALKEKLEIIFGKNAFRGEL